MVDLQKCGRIALKCINAIVQWASENFNKFEFLIESEAFMDTECFLKV